MNKYISIIAGISVISLAVAVSFTDTTPTYSAKSHSVQTDPAINKPTPIVETSPPNDISTAIENLEHYTQYSAPQPRGELQSNVAPKGQEKPSIVKADPQINDNYSVKDNYAVEATNPSVFKNPEQQPLPEDIQALLDQEAQQQNNTQQAYPEEEDIPPQHAQPIDPVKQAQLEKTYQDFKEEIKYYEFNERFNLSKFMDDERLRVLDAKQGNELIEYVFQKLQGVVLLETQPDAAHLLTEAER